MAMEEQIWGRIVIIGKDGKERKAEMDLEDVEGDPYLFGRCDTASHCRITAAHPLSIGMIHLCALPSGRAKTSDICINMPSVSRKHAELSKDSRGQVRRVRLAHRARPRPCVRVADLSARG